jgi:phosphoribosyl-ATP pyrophosphohydrolase
MKLDFSQVVTISKADGLSTNDALVKLFEESGELASAHLCKHNVANKSRSSEPNTAEEAVDVLMCAMDYLIKDGVTEEELNAMLQRKIAKWERKMFGPPINHVIM